MKSDCSRMYKFLLLVCVVSVSGITNNADLIWFDKENGEAHNYFARQPIPEGLIKTPKIVVNQKFPILWEVKFAFFDNLESLMIDDCGVNEIRPNTFKDLKPLTNLSLTQNNIKELKEGVFNNVLIKNLNFSYNKISTIAPAAFDNMSVLESVILDYNELKQWCAEWFFNSTNIKTISITHNFLEGLPEKAFKNFWINRDDAVSIYFSYNKIGRIDPAAFEQVKNFNNLFLDWNDMDSIDGHTFEKLTIVQHLNLNGDFLYCLSEEFMELVLNKTKQLSLKENPLKCECRQNLIQKAAKLQVTVHLSPKDCS